MVVQILPREQWKVNCYFDNMYVQFVFLPQKHHVLNINAVFKEML